MKDVVLRYQQAFAHKADAFLNIGSNTSVNRPLLALFATTHKQKFKIILEHLNRLTALGSGGNEKHTPRGIPMVGIVRKVLSTTNKQSHKHHHHGGAVGPSYGVGSMDPPNLMQVTSSKVLHGVRGELAVCVVAS
jgi:hypothetical protein